MMLRVLLGMVGMLGLALGTLGDAPERAATLTFEVGMARGLLEKPTEGRILILISPHARPEPRLSLGDVESRWPVILGRDASAFSPGKTVRVDASAPIFPVAQLAKLPAGEYHVQAVFDHHRDLRLPNAPGNLVSVVQRVSLDPFQKQTVALELTRKLPEEMLPANTEEIHYLKFRSEKLSRFHGRPIYLRAGVILPPGYTREKEKTYPLRVHIGGYGTRYTAVRGMMSSSAEFRQAWQAKNAPKMILLHVDGAGPLGDPYQVNSANHGPYGDALTQELIPYVEKRFRGIGQPQARVLDGHSTGGWVSLALQIFYPDYFNGAWSHAPDPVDFRAFELINIYRDANAYVTATGQERPACRHINGEVRYTMRHEVQLENVLGWGDSWTRSGKDWGAWNATFGPRGKDGLPVPLWDKKTGVIDRSVLEHWKQYDLRLHLEQNWSKLGPKLRGKMRIWVGEADDYYLNHAVHLLDAFLKTTKPAYAGKITYGARRGHSWRGLSEKELMREMAEAIAGGKPGS